MSAATPVARIGRVPLWFGLAPDLHGQLAERARGRTVLIDWFASRCCTNVTIGDLVVRLVGAPPGRDFV